MFAFHPNRTFGQHWSGTSIAVSYTAMVRYLALALIPLAGASAAAASLSGIGRSIDGDSLKVGQQEVRLFGIDAPELTQTCTRGGKPWACGSASADQLSKLVTGKQVKCEPVGTDKYGRILARCSAGNTDINRIMVATGYALAYRRYSMDFNSAEESARLAKRGIWSSTFDLPSEVRHPGDDYKIEGPVDEQQSRRERPVATNLGSKPQPSGNCRIKGNRSRNGEGIYHLPGMPYYSQTVAEQIFCTEAEARAAGYRRSRADRHR